MIIEKKPLLMNLQLFGEGGQTDPNDPQDTDPIDITELQKTMLDMKTEMEKLKKENMYSIWHYTMKDYIIYVIMMYSCQKQIEINILTKKNIHKTGDSNTMMCSLQ